MGELLSKVLIWCNKGNLKKLGNIIINGPIMWKRIIILIAFLHIG